MRLFSWLFYLLSICLVAYGFVTMYVYGNYFNGAEGSAYYSQFGHVVNYQKFEADKGINLIIDGLRGLGMIVSGMISALFATCLTICRILKSK